MTSPARLEANRKNSLRSTGPVTPAGRVRSSQNSYKHGLYAKTAVVPGAEAKAFQAWRDEWVERHQPQGVDEANTVDRAAHAAWKLHRCALVETANLEKRRRYAAEKHDHAQRDRAEALGHFLFLGYDTFDHPSARRHDPNPDPMNPNPGATFRELQEFKQGADRLIQGWRDLLALLDGPHGRWDDNERHRAVRLFGKRPEDAMFDARLKDLFITINTANDDRHNLNRNFYRAGATVCLQTDPNPNARWTPEEVAAGKVALRGIVETEVERLLALKADELDLRDELDVECAVQGAMFDDSESGKTLRRYETACERDLHRALMDLLKLQAGRPGKNEAIAKGIEEKDVVAEGAANSPLAPVPGGEGRGEGECPSPVAAGKEDPSPRPSPRSAGRGGKGAPAKNEAIAEVISPSTLPASHPAPPRRTVDEPAARPWWDNPGMSGAPRVDRTGGGWVREGTSG